MTDADLVADEQIQRAAAGMHPAVLRSPLLRAGWAGVPGGLWLKAENLQPIASFKIRGAFTAAARLDPAVRAAGLITHSSGNHAQAVAWAARAFGVPAVAVMPLGAPGVKVEAVRGLGAEIVFVPAAERAIAAERIRAERGMILVHPFDDADVIAGQGTVGMEICEQLPEVGTVLVPVGGGGLISGVAVAVRARAPQARVVAVEPELAGDLAEGFAAGRRAVWEPDATRRTIADGLRAPAVGLLPWRHISTLVDSVWTVRDEQVLEAMAMAAVYGRSVVEPSGAVALAAALAGAVDPRAAPTVAVLTGGCVQPELLSRVLADPVPPARAPY